MSHDIEPKAVPAGATRYRLNARLMPDLEVLKLSKKTAYYGIRSCWWSDRIVYTTRTPGERGLPCDARGGMLMQTAAGDARTFVENAEADPKHYGPSGMSAFGAMFHGVVEVRTADGSWRPTCFAEPASYSRILEAASPLGECEIEGLV